MVFALATASNKNESVGAVMIWGTFPQTTVDGVLHVAADANPLLQGVSYVQKDAATYREVLTEALASGTGPDLYFMTQEQSVQDAGKSSHIPATSLTLTQFQNAFIDAALPLYAADGVVALPIIADPLVLFWNRDMMAAGGYASPPQYWDELPTIAQRITQYDEARTISKAAVAMGEYRNINTAKDILTTLMLQAGTSIVDRDMATGKLKVGFGSESNGSKPKVLDALVFYTRFADPADVSYAWSRALPEARDAFIEARVALYIGRASDRALIAASNPNLNFSMAGLPQIRSTATPVTSSRIHALALSRSSKNPNGALTVAYLMAASPVATPLAQSLGMAPALRDALTPQTQGVADLVYKAVIMSRSWVDPNPGATSEVFKDLVESVVSGGDTVSAAVEDAADEFNAIIGI